MALRRKSFPDVDNEMASLLAIARERANPSQNYPEVVKRAFETAYAVHFRSFMVFCHSQRPPFKSHPKDICLSDFFVAAGKIGYTKREEKRVRAADQLVSHLSPRRAQRRHSTRVWGGPQDHELTLKRIKEILAKYPEARSLFPRCAHELDLLPSP